MRKNMNKNKRFNLSQKAHDRLYWKLDWNRSALEDKKKNYHAAVFEVQEGKQRILTKQEKQNIYKHC